MSIKSSINKVSRLRVLFFLYNYKNRVLAHFQTRLCISNSMNKIFIHEIHNICIHQIALVIETELNFSFSDITHTH